MSTNLIFFISTRFVNKNYILVIQCDRFRSCRTLFFGTCVFFILMFLFFLVLYCRRLCHCCLRLCHCRRRRRCHRRFLFQFCCCRLLLFRFSCFRCDDGGHLLWLHDFYFRNDLENEKSLLVSKYIFVHVLTIFRYAYILYQFLLLSLF